MRFQYAVIQRKRHRIFITEVGAILSKSLYSRDTNVQYMCLSSHASYHTAYEVMFAKR